VAGSVPERRLVYFGRGSSKVALWHLGGNGFLQFDFQPATDGVSYRLKLIASPDNGFINTIMNTGLFKRVVYGHMREVIGRHHPGGGEAGPGRRRGHTAQPGLVGGGEGQDSGLPPAPPRVTPARKEDREMNTRIERDSFGPIEVPADRLWGAQTQRSLQHFKISGERMPRALIHALALVKKAAALVNLDLKMLSEEKAQAIVSAADEVLAGRHDDEFPLVVWQTGSGTQTNMNMNEVLANRASEILGGERGEKRLVHPNDDVNKGQSTNDVFPTAMSVAAVDALRAQVIPALTALRRRLPREGRRLPDIPKIGRTHLQGRHAPDPGPGVLRLRLAARARPRPPRGLAAAPAGAGAGRHRVGTGLQRPPRVRDAGGGAAGHADRLRLRDRPEQVRGPGRQRRARPSRTAR
jgi:hypothetical protein